KRLDVPLQHRRQGLIIDGEVELLSKDPSLICDDPVELLSFTQLLSRLRIEDEALETFQELESVSDCLGRPNDRLERGSLQEVKELILLLLRQLEHLLDDVLNAAGTGLQGFLEQVKCQPLRLR